MRESLKGYISEYEKELNSFKMEDLKKIYDETGVSIYRTIRYLQPKENEKDIPPGHLGLTICPVETAQEAIDILLEQAN